MKYEQALLATNVSLYQMLPREHHRLRIDSDGNRTGLDYMSADFWRQNEWGPLADLRNSVPGTP